jgi:protein involved in polysaccharide export with SLBB domain
MTHLEHINERRERVVVDVDLSDPQARNRVLHNGDLLRIPAIRDTFENSVALIGNVYRAGQFQWRSGLHLTDVLTSINELKPNADPHYILIRREDPVTKHITVRSADLQRALQQPRGPNDPTLAPRDTVVVFDIDAGRDQYMTPVLEQLRRQASRTEPAAIVRISGKVVAPGDYPLEPGMTVADLIRAGGGLLENAYGGSGELARYTVIGGETRTTAIAEVNVQDALADNASANLKLSPSDLLVVKEISEWSRQETVRLEGEVKFPGEYPIERGETLRHVIDRAGGLTSLAFSEGSVFTRESLRIREQEQLKVLSERMKQDLGALALQVAGSEAVQGGNIKGSPTETLAIGQALLSELQSTQAVGRLVIDLPRVMRAQEGSSDDLLLRDGDRLVVPRRSQEVTIIGEVQNSTSMLYDPSLSREDYIQQSGGVTRRADEKNIYVVRANGSVDARSGSSWFGSSKEDMRPGDTIVVPLDAERMQPLPLWTAITTIMYNIAVAVAAVNSF